MTKTSEQKQRVESTDTGGASGPPRLTRGAAASLLGCSTSTIRRLEASDRLHPIVATDGVHVFDPAELARERATRTARTRPRRPLRAASDGEADAQVFELLAEGMGLRAIVTTLRLPVDRVSKLYAAWVTAGAACEMSLSNEALGQLARLLACSRIKSPADLLARVREWRHTLEAEFDALQVESNRSQSEYDDLIAAVAKLAATRPELRDAITGLRSAIAPGIAEQFATALAYYLSPDHGEPVVNRPPPRGDEPA